MKLASLALTIACMAAPVMAQEHDHGVNGLPDWYDPSCCTQRDCRPVPDSDIEFLMQGGSDFVRHIPTGLMFQRSQWKLSQDERYHVCIHDDGAAEDGDNMKRPLCVYIRAGA